MKPQLHGGPLDGLEIEPWMAQIMDILGDRANAVGEPQPFAFLHEGQVKIFFISGRHDDEPQGAD